jgi:tetratricopeptide (TPR) repeat protein
LLDNAADEEQVRPLLPAGGQSIALVTSRRTLARLDGTRHVELDTFTAGEGLALLRRMVGPQRVHAEEQATARLVELCANLPLAIAIAATLLTTRPALHVADVVHLLETGDRLEELSAGDRALRTVFDVSFRYLSPELQHAFVYLALHPGQDFDAASSAALLGISPPDARSRLESLLTQHLVQQAKPRRYRFHDLVREFAIDVAKRSTPASETTAATERLVNYYLNTAWNADRLIRTPALLDISDIPPTTVEVSLGDASKALAWLDNEANNLVAIVGVAADRGWSTASWKTAACLTNYLSRRRQWREWFATHEVGLAQARRSGDNHGEATMLCGLGQAHFDSGQIDSAEEMFNKALSIAKETGYWHGEGVCLDNLGVIEQHRDNQDGAIVYHRQALDLFNTHNNPAGQARALINLGAARFRQDRLHEAVEFFGQALRRSEEAGDIPGVALALHDLGETYQAMGDHRRAIEHLDRAIMKWTEARDRREAHSLMTRGQSQFRLRQFDSAIESCEKARAIFIEIGDERQVAECNETLDEIRRTQSGGDGVTHSY